MSVSKIAYIALGSNLDNPSEQLQLAMAHMHHIPNTAVIDASSVLKTAPIGPQNQPDFMNQVAVLETTLSAHELLYALQAIENKMGRVRNQHWGPRIIDLDILLFGHEKIQTDDLIVPHPEIQNRSFVMELLHECHEKNRDLSGNL
jgi:2-amino-4-hydroxy-6-hydroxymethyldihydropteridine diphosphokinase